MTSQGLPGDVTMPLKFSNAKVPVSVKSENTLF